MGKADLLETGADLQEMVKDRVEVGPDQEAPDDGDPNINSVSRSRFE